MSRPTVAIVGRPNVGKSTLFNRMVGGRRAIVSDQAGTTRDRHFGEAEWEGRRFWLVDTGGLVPDADTSIDRAIRQQVDYALAEADLVLFVVDGRDGLTPIDRAIADRLRKAQRPVLLAVNKLDDLERATAQYDFYALGFGDPLGVSAAAGKGSGDLLDAVEFAVHRKHFQKMLQKRRDFAGEDALHRLGSLLVADRRIGQVRAEGRHLRENLPQRRQLVGDSLRELPFVGQLDQCRGVCNGGGGWMNLLWHFVAWVFNPCPCSRTG